MITVKVIRTFRDRHTGETHRVGDLISVSAERLAEIASKGEFVVLWDADSKKDLNAMTVAELREYAAEIGIDLGTAKKKTEILAVMEGVL